MTIKISKRASESELKLALRKMQAKKKKINLDKYFGKVDFGTDGLSYQKKIRNDWK